MNALLQPGVRRREVWAWAMYDFANSGYTTVVITAVFSAYFVGVVAGNAPWATFAWTLALSVSYALVMLTAPLIGAYADAHASKKKLLLLTTLGCVGFTALLYFAVPGALVLAIAALVLSNTFFGTGENLIAAFLPELARPRALGRVSGWGWSLGYVGGLVSLGASLAYIGWAQKVGQGAAEFVPASMLITAAIFALASLPTLLMLRERATPQPDRTGRSAWAQVQHTLGHLGRLPDLKRFLICTVLYQAGIQSVITLAAIYASQVFHFDTQRTIMLVLVVNITAAIGAFIFGHVQDRIGHVRSIALTLAGWIVMVLLAWVAPDERMFWVAANLAGLCMGASQSAGRAMVGLLAPPAQQAEFFGLWGLAVKLASIIGPLTYGIASWATLGDHRQSLLITGSYFVAGLGVLRGVQAARGHRAARRFARISNRCMAAFTIEETDWACDAERLGAVRRAVFIDEQGVPEALEWDEHDAAALHLLATTVDGSPIGCARLLPDGHIGRMAVLPVWRGLGVGRALLAAATGAALARGNTRLMLSAQTHAAAFYAHAGFAAVGDAYEEAGIPHIAMRKILDCP
jgi:UMF1 family MFS transporter